MAISISIHCYVTKGIRHYDFLFEEAKLRNIKQEKNKAKIRYLPAVFYCSSSRSVYPELYEERDY